MTFNFTIKSLSLLAALALAGCTGTEAPSEPVAPQPLSKAAYEVETGCAKLDDFLGSFGPALACQSGDVEACYDDLVKGSEPVFKCYDIQLPSSISSASEFKDFADELNDKLSQYDNPAKQQELIDCLCGGGGAGVSGGLSVAAGSGFNATSSQAAGTGFNATSSQAAGTGFNATSSKAAGSGFNATGSKAAGTGFQVD